MILYRIVVYLELFDFRLMMSLRIQIDLYYNFVLSFPNVFQFFMPMTHIFF